MPNESYFGYYFKECNSLETVTVESISEIGYNAFKSVGAALKGDIVINEGVTKIYGEGVFSGCSSITSVSFPSTLTEIGAGAFKNCTSLKTAKLPTGVTLIGDWAFENCSSLEDEVVIEEGVTVGRWAFGGKCGIKKLTVKDNAIIKMEAFQECYNLSNV